MIQSKDKRPRYKFFKSLEATHLSKPIVYFKYSPYSGINSYHFVWILPAESDARDDSQFANIVTAISQDIPKYHTRHMRASFRETFGSLVSAKPVLFDEMYRYLTNDCLTPRNNASKEVRARLLLAVTCEDTDVVVDLREHNGSPEKYSEFWEGVNDVLTRNFPSATEERRQSTASFLPVAVSIKDLVRKVIALKPNILVPSESWIVLQFQPKNRSANTALNYTGKFDIVYKPEHARPNTLIRIIAWHFTSIYVHLQSCIVIMQTSFVKMTSTG